MGERRNFGYRRPDTGKTVELTADYADDWDQRGKHFTAEGAEITEGY
jgi:hypothetical protein